MMGPSPPAERVLCRFLFMKAAETSDGALQSPCPGLDNAASIVFLAQRIGEQRPRTYHKNRPLPTCPGHCLVRGQEILAR